MIGERNAGRILEDEITREIERSITLVLEKVIDSAFLINPFTELRWISMGNSPTVISGASM